MALKKFFSLLKWIDPFTYVDLWLMPKINPNKNETISWIVYLISAFVFAFVLYSLIGLLLSTPAPMVIVVSNSMTPELHRGDIVIVQGVSPENISGDEVELSFNSLQGIPSSNYLLTMCSEKNSQNLINCNSFKNQVLQNKQFSVDSFDTRQIIFSDGQELNLNKKGDIIVYFSDLQQKPIIHRIVAKLKVKDGFYALTKGDSEYNPLIDQEAGITSSAIRLDSITGKAVAKIPLLGFVKLIIFDDLTCFVFGPPSGQKCVFP